VFRLFKWLLILSLLAGAGTSLWTSFAVWAGLYSVYSYPLSEDHPEGATLIIKREEKEPMFNSPDYIPVREKRRSADGKPGIGFGTVEFAKMKPLSIRTVFTLPYVDWAYRKSLNESQLKKLDEGALHKQKKRFAK